ncbi:S8 family serine peptidase [Actinomycetes bacterium KLBMP 9797]
MGDLEKLMSADRPLAPAHRRQLQTRRRATAVGLAVFMFMTGAVVDAAEARTGPPGTAVPTTPSAASIDPASRATLDATGQVDVIVTYKAAQARQGAVREAQKQGGLRKKAGKKAYVQAATNAYGKLKRGAVERIGRGVQVLRDYDALPVQYVHVPSPEAMRSLLADPAVVSVRENTLTETDLAQSLPLVHQPEVAAQGDTGSGTAVAVIDTGVDYARTAFGSCKSTGGSCRVAYAQDFAKDDRKLDDDGHGTNVAGTVLGMAPSTKIVALDVFTKKGTKAQAADVDIIAALEWVVAHQADYNITAINLSLGDSAHHVTECTTSSLAEPFADALVVGAVPVVSAGNDAYVDGKYVSGVSYPACTPGTVRVGAVYDSDTGSQSWGSKKTHDGCTDSTTAADKIVCFSQGGPLLSVLAPGALITAAGSTKSGTSQAAPHVAGAVAVLTGAFPTAANSEVTYALGQGGPGLIDPREGTIDDPPPGGFLIVNRLDLLGAFTALRELTANRRVVGNGTIELGVNQLGHLNAPNGDGGVVGLRYVPTGADALVPGCLCEGWGVGDPALNLTGYANESTGVSDNLNLVSATYTATSAVSTVQVGTALRITHDYHPSTTPNLYEVTVSVTNVSGTTATPITLGNLRYRRVMDWDVPPTPFAEYVTLHKGPSPAVEYISDDGFASPDPATSPSAIHVAGDVVDSGPNDHGALVDLNFGSLAPGGTRTFTLYYGAAGDETVAMAALSKVGVTAYSLGQPSTPDGPGVGTPNTFVFGFKD